jgi:hypothetical protein
MGVLDGNRDIYDRLANILLGQTAYYNQDLTETETDYTKPKSFVQNIFYAYVYDDDLITFLNVLNQYGIPRKLLSNPINTLNEYEIYATEDLYNIIRERLRNTRINFMSQRWFEYTKYAATVNQLGTSNTYLQAIKTSNEIMQADTADIKNTNTNLDTKIITSNTNAVVAVSSASRLELIDSTTTPLQANATYTSQQYNVSGFKRVCGTCFADAAGTLYIDQSSNGTNYDYTSTFNVKASKGLSFSVEITAPYVRIRYTNGNTAQTVFRLFTFKREIS